MKRNIVVMTNKEAGVPAEVLYLLEETAYKQWTEAGIYTPMKDATFEQFERSIKGKVVFVAQDAATGELLAMHTLRLNKRQGSALGADLSVSSKAQHQGIASRMLEAEAQRLSKNGYRYMTGSTAIPATWSEKIGDGSLDPLFRNSHCNATLSKREVAIDVRWEDVRIKTVDV